MSDKVADVAPELSRAEFVAAAMQGSIADTSADTWVVWVQAQQARSEILSLTFQFLGLVHAPVAAKLFNYFDCHEITPHHAFLVDDYSLECGVGAHQEFLAFVILFMAAFAFGLPLALSVVLLANRTRLHTPRVVEKYGFLYEGYRKGTEFWDVHELVRRMSLTGLDGS